MNAFGRFLARTVDVSTVIGLIAVALMMLHITIDVAGKFLLNTPVPATISLVSHYYMVVVAFLPIAFAERRRAHITVEVLTELFPARAQHHLYAWSYVLSAVVYGLLTFRSWDEARRAHEIGAFIMEQSTKLIVWPSYYLLPIGMGLMTIAVVYRFLVYLTGAKDSFDEPPTLEQAAARSAADAGGSARG
jgi:TRAP-type C4-dicarboxylate transport system permease small subunit